MALIHFEREYLSRFKEQAPDILDEYLKLKKLNYYGNGFRYTWPTTELFLEIFVEEQYPELFGKIEEPKYMTARSSATVSTKKYVYPPSLYILCEDKWWHVASAFTHVGHISTVIKDGVKVQVKKSVEYNCLKAFLDARDIAYVNCTLGAPAQDLKCRCQHEGDVTQNDVEGKEKMFSKPPWSKLGLTPTISTGCNKEMPEYRGWYWSQIFPELSETITVAPGTYVAPDLVKSINLASSSSETSENSEKCLNLQQSFAIIDHLLDKIDMGQVKEFGNKIVKSTTWQERIDILVSYSQVLQSIHDYKPPTEEEMETYYETGHWV